jgi:hypothetical protein
VEVVTGTLDDVLLLVELEVVVVVGRVDDDVLDDVLGVVPSDVLDDVLEVVPSDVLDDVLEVVPSDVLEVDEVVTTVLVVVTLVVDVVVPPLDAQRNAKCLPDLIVFAQAPPVSSADEPIDSRASGPLIAAWIRLCAGSFTRIPPTSRVGSGVPESGGTVKVVASPRTTSPSTTIDVGSPGEMERTTSRPVRMLQNEYAPVTRTTTAPFSATRSP